MVNTFLPNPDYERSAEVLDTKRLGSQRREAKMILNILKYLRSVQEYLGLEEMPTDPYLRYDWLRMVVKSYKECNFNLLYRNNEWHQVDKDTKFIRIPAGAKMRIRDDGYACIWKDGKMNKIKYGYPAPEKGRNRNVTQADGSVIKEWQPSKTLFIIESERVVDTNNGEMWVTLTGGYTYHPCVLMWLGYEDSLNEYLDCILAEWVKRGNANSMPFSGIVGAPKPIWVHDVGFYKTHRSNLLKKNPEHFRKFWPELPDYWPYFWPYALKCGAENGTADTDKRYAGGYIHLSYTSS